MAVYDPWLAKDAVGDRSLISCEPRALNPTHLNPEKFHPTFPNLPPSTLKAPKPEVVLSLIIVIYSIKSSKS